MGLQRLLLERKAPITGKWFQLLADAYPPETSRLLRQQGDRFSNPVGYTLSRGVERLFQGLLEGAGPEKLSPALDDMVRVRAVQDWSPAEAVGFVFLLKKIVREEIGNEAQRSLAFELAEFDLLIDRVALMAFDIYSACRERIYEIRVREVKAGKFRPRATTRRAGLPAAPGTLRSGPGTVREER